MNKAEKKLLKKKYLEENPDPYQELKNRYSKISSLDVSDFEKLNDIDLELHILNYINFNLLKKNRSDTDKIKSLPEAYRNFYLTYYYETSISQDSIYQYLDSGFVDYINETLAALTTYKANEHYKFLSELKKKIDAGEKNFEEAENTFFQIKEDLPDLVMKFV